VNASLHQAIGAVSDASQRLRVLCLDVEGGHGGSSRSLYAMLASMDRTVIVPEVWCRRDGALELYRNLGIPCRIEPDLPRFTTGAARLRDDLSQLRQNLLPFIRAHSLIRRLAHTIEERFDVVHFNHTAFFLLAYWLRRHTRKPFVMHVRTRPKRSVLSHWQAQLMFRTVNDCVFITENEKRHYEALTDTAFGGVIYNPFLPPSADLRPLDGLPGGGRLRIASLSSFAWVRGVDRLVEVAEALARKKRTDFMFVVAGDLKLPHTLGGEIGRIARSGGTFADFIAARGLGHLFHCTGHIPQPERLVLACHAVIKLSRENDPWGRDIIEALGLGRPVVSVGTWDRFIEHGVTGFLRPEFDAVAVADDLICLADDPALRERLGAAGRARIRALCSGPDRAADLLSRWRAVNEGQALGEPARDA